MTSRERVFAVLEGRPVDRQPLMPITMMLAADQTGARYGRYALEHPVLVEAQLCTAARFGFDHVSAITETREARDCGAVLCYFDDQPYAIDETQARLRDKGDLACLALPDPNTAPAMSDRLAAIRVLRARHVDSLVSMAEARARMGDGQVLLGGIDPVRVLLQGTPDEVAAAVRQCRREAGRNYIVGAGCEVPRATPAANLAALCASAEAEA